MTTKDIIFGVVLVLVSVGLSYMLFGRTSTPVAKFGAVGQMLAEQYIPYIAVNQGYRSALPVTTTGVGTASSTVVSGAPICAEFYATSTATLLHFVASTTPTLPHGAAAVMTAAYGTCN